MEKDSGHKLEVLAVDGGMSSSDITMQTQADISKIRVERPAMRETTALGAAIAAGLATKGCWTSLQELYDITQNKPGRTNFDPVGEPKKIQIMYDRWERAVEMSRGWVLATEEEWAIQQTGNRSRHGSRSSEDGL
jgi:glycerol kinase